MVVFRDHITGDILMESENGSFEFVDELFFKFRGNYIEVDSNSEGKKTVVDILWNYKMKKFDMWRVEKDIFDFGEKLGELVEGKMYGEKADFTYMVDYIFNLRAWFRANRETKDIQVYIGPSSTYMNHAYAKNFTPVFLKEENGIPFVYIFKETVHADGLIEDKMAEISLEEKNEEENSRENNSKEKGKSEFNAASDAPSLPSGTTAP
uniref:ULP_PROTEASE domain-containing protein n=1 Tax=Caenorhabditis tropicalis TaxID=1561998 RepID=A0A1I7T8S4_9PELO